MMGGRAARGRRKRQNAQRDLPAPTEEACSPHQPTPQPRTHSHTHTHTHTYALEVDGVQAGRVDFDDGVPRLGRRLLDVVNRDDGCGAERGVAGGFHRVAAMSGGGLQVRALRGACGEGAERDGACSREEKENGEETRARAEKLPDAHCSLPPKPKGALATSPRLAGPMAPLAAHYQPLPPTCPPPAGCGKRVQRRMTGPESALHGRMVRTSLRGFAPPPSRATPRPTQGPAAHRPSNLAVPCTLWLVPSWAGVCRRAFPSPVASAFGSPWTGRRVVRAPLSLSAPPPATPPALARALHAGASVLYTRSQ